MMSVGVCNGLIERARTAGLYEKARLIMMPGCPDGKSKVSGFYYGTEDYLLTYRDPGSIKVMKKQIIRYIRQGI